MTQRPESAMLDVAESFASAARAAEIMQQHFAIFQAACSAYDWKTAEQARFNAAAAFDTFFDHIYVAHKRLEPVKG